MFPKAPTERPCCTLYMLMILNLFSKNLNLKIYSIVEFNDDNSCVQNELNQMVKWKKIMFFFQPWKMCCCGIFPDWKKKLRSIFQTNLNFELHINQNLKLFLYFLYLALFIFILIFLIVSSLTYAGITILVGYIIKQYYVRNKGFSLRF